MRRNWSFGQIFLFIPLSLFLLIGCTGGTDNASSSTGYDLNNLGTNYSLPTSTNTSGVDVSIPGSYNTTTTSPAQQVNNGGSLFDPNTSVDAPPAAVPGQGSLGQNDLACLTSNTSIFGNTSGNAASCFTQGSNPWDPNNMYVAGVQSLGILDVCLQMAMQNAPTSTDSASVVQQKFIQSRLFLVRCYRMVADAQARYAPWGSQYQQQFTQTDWNWYNWMPTLAQPGY